MMHVFRCGDIVLTLDAIALAFKVRPVWAYLNL
jgi:hypothetical protein